jgi:hypothetical protein
VCVQPSGGQENNDQQARFCVFHSTFSPHGVHQHQTHHRHGQVIRGDQPRAAEEVQRGHRAFGRESHPTAAHSRGDDDVSLTLLLHEKSSRQTGFFWSFAPHLKRIANARSVRTNLSEVGKKVKRVRYLQFLKKNILFDGQKLFKTHIPGVFEIFFAKKLSILLRANRKKTKTFSCFLESGVSRRF